jgi:hydroxyethylthiazole kinase-like sugar kinase family protein
MSRRTVTFLSGSVLAAATLIPSPAVAAAHGEERPLTGTATGTSTLNFVTGTSTADITGHLSHLGAANGQETLTVTLTSATTFTYTGTRTLVAANGDKVFSTVTGSGTFSPSNAQSTDTGTITGGTGRFAEATGTYTGSVSFVTVSANPTSETSRFTATLTGQISY